ncbi:hypothetical protein P152DRAFT_66383 [Eremomyces bilateralis CBS 781.70]|uniref:Uncharacterized protein n=1 Tax=Eremomyces bilateralis CBS 781.70 TaxID=1392243 RepID=A0A6G1FZS8_9PEZI|nr:uncharacterized protein P152DRAFT_66383 [Eremomyces bilateralis CBS 781.70]KAF1811232.1 hypothetical protein P152DRAFT_66383 [Eremomyces bilateralis CBS 781.70]
MRACRRCDQWKLTLGWFQALTRWIAKVTGATRNDSVVVLRCRRPSANTTRRIDGCTVVVRRWRFAANKRIRRGVMAGDRDLMDSDATFNGDRVDSR